MAHTDLYTQEEYRYELENRMKNLLWTVSGDYELDVPLDVQAFANSKYIALYDAVKQGAFSRWFSRDDFGLYLMKKVYLGAEEQSLANLAQLCVDQAIIEKVAAERPGVQSLRTHAFEDILERDFSKLSAPGNIVGRVKIALMQEGINGSYTAEKSVREKVEQVRELRDAADAMEIIRRLDLLYNTWIDPDFEKNHGSLEQVLAVNNSELKEFSWQDFLNEEALEAMSVNMFDANESVLEEPENGEESGAREKRKGILLVDEEAAAKMYSYIELNFGRSYLDGEQQARLNRRICRGIHGGCQLYYTNGILNDFVKQNNTYVIAQKTMRNNKEYYGNHQRVARQNIAKLGSVLKRSLQMRNEEEKVRGAYGSLIPRLAWKIGRTSDQTAHMFERTIRHKASDFVVDLLIDASGSQRKRQQLVALQGYILSAALSKAEIPHRVMGFSTFWDYTVMRRYREYDDGAEADWNLMEFTASSNNRDGLAIRATADALLQRQEENKVLIVLSDGRPNDQVINRPDIQNKVLYTGEYAVKDTAAEVRRARAQGIMVLGVFVGEEQDLLSERRIFGKDFAYIRSVDSFAHVVGSYLKKLIDEWE